MKNSDAHTAAAIAWDRIIETGSPLAVLLVEGVVRTADPSKKTGYAYIIRNQQFHVGTYSSTAKVLDIAIDILDFYCATNRRSI